MNNNIVNSFPSSVVSALVGGNSNTTSSGAKSSGPAIVPYSPSEYATSGSTPKNKSPSRGISNFFSRSFSQSHANPHGLMSSTRMTPPASPTTPKTAGAAQHGSLFDFKMPMNTATPTAVPVTPNDHSMAKSMADSPPVLYACHQVKYIGSTVLRRRNTLPMLNWIVTELLYQSKCDGEELHVRIRNCKKSDEAFKHLRAQLTKETHHHGLSVKLEMRQIQQQRPANIGGKPGPTGSNEVAFQVSNLIDGQMLLNHSFRRVFLFGKFSRESSLFYYLHKDQDDRNAVPTLYVFQANDDAQLSEICVKYNELRPTLNAPDDKHLFLNSFIGKTGVTSNCFEVLHVGSVVVSQKRATPSMIDRAAEEFGKLNHQDTPTNSQPPSTGAPAAKPPPPFTQVTINNPTTTTTTTTTTNGKQLNSSALVNGTRRQYKTKRFLVEVIDENEPLETTTTTITTPTYHTSSSPTTASSSASSSSIPQNTSMVSASASASSSASSIFASSTSTSPTTLISNTQSLDCDTRKLLLKEFQDQQHKQQQLSGVLNNSSTSSSSSSSGNGAISTADNNSACNGSETKVHVKDIDFSGNDEAEQNKLQVPEMDDVQRTILQQQYQQSGGMSALKRSSSGETTLINDSIMLRQMQIENFANRNKSNNPNQPNQNGSNLARKNKTMLFIIGQLDICLISTENHKTVLSKTFSNISHCSQGVQHADHFGIIVREPFSPNSYSESYVCHIFKCQTQPIVNELLGSLKQAFNNAYRASKIKQQQNGTNSAANPAASATAAGATGMSATNGSMAGNDDIVYNEGAKSGEPYCANCPMNWFHQLCLDIDGLDNSTIFVLLMFRIEQHSSQEKLQEFYLILDLLNLDQTGQKVDVLMILLKARADRMQRRHEIDGCQLNSMTIYDQIDDNQSDSRSTSSLTRLEGLRLMAKNSLTNTFESLRKINKNFQSSENLQKSNSGYFSHLGNNGSIGGGGDGRPSQSYMDNRRNTLAECFTESVPLQQVFIRPPETLLPANKQLQKCNSLGNNSELDKQESSNNNNNNSTKNKPALAKPSQTKLSALGELSQELDQLELDPTDGPRYLNPTANTGESEQHFSKNLPSPSSASSLVPTATGAVSSPSSSSSSSNVTRHRNERQLSLNSYHQIRYKLFARIQKTINDRDASFNKRSSRWQPNNSRRNNNTNSKLSRKRTPRELWKYAIQEHLLMIKMYKQNQQKQMSQQNEVKKQANNRVRFDYDEIPSIGSREKRRELIATWDKIIESFNVACISLEQPEKPAEIESTLVQLGIPRNRKRDVWLFMASYYKQSRPLAQDTSDVDIETYRNMLEQLSTQQHAIFVDLGRTFPNVPFYGETMGSGQLSLFNILKAYSLYDKEVEYCQGLSFLAGILLLHMSEDEAFKLMCFMLYNCGLRDQYKPDMDALKMQMYQLCRLLFEHNQPLHDHLERHQVKPDLYAAPCFLTVFAAKFPISFVVRVFDFLIYYGIEVLFRIFIALLDRISAEMLECNDFESIMQLMKNRLSSFESTAEMEILFCKIAELNFVSKLELYKAEYKTMQAEQAISNTKNIGGTGGGSGVVANVENSATTVETVANKTVHFSNQTVDSDNTKNLSAKIDELMEENCYLKKQIDQLHTELDKERDTNRDLNSRHSIQIEQLQSQIKEQYCGTPQDGATAKAKVIMTGNVPDGLLNKSEENFR